MLNRQFISCLLMAFSNQAFAVNPLRWITDPIQNVGRFIADPFDYVTVGDERWANEVRAQAASARGTKLVLAAVIAALVAAQDDAEEQPTFILEEAVTKNPFASRARAFLLDRKYKPVHSMPYLALFENDYQVAAVDLLTRFRKTDIYEKAPGVVGFRSPFAVQALQILLERGDKIDERIFLLARFSSEEQVDVLRANIKRMSFERICAEKLGFGPYEFQSFGLAAAELMTEHGRNIVPSTFMLAQLSNQFQVDAIQLLLEHEQQVVNHLPGILAFTNEYPVRAMRLILEGERPLGQTIFYLGFLSNDIQLAEIERRVREELPIREHMMSILRMGRPEKDTTIHPDSCRAIIGPQEE